MMRITIFIWVLILPVGVSLGQPVSNSRLQVSAGFGALSTASSSINLFGESVGTLDRSLQVTHMAVAFHKSERLSFSANYFNGQQPDIYPLAGLDSPPSGFFIGGTARAGAYTNTFRYGVHVFNDSLNQDVLWIDQSFGFVSGHTSQLTMWAGMGADNQFVWMMMGGLSFPVTQQFKLEPVAVIASTPLYEQSSTPNARIGLRAHFGLFEKGKISAGATQPFSGDANRFAFTVSGAFPLLKRHAISISVQQYESDRETTTAVTFGGTLGIGRRR